MAKITNLTNFAKIFVRFRSTVIEDISDVYRNKLRERKEEIIELIKEKSSRAMKSELAQKMRTAKGFYQLEMSPPNVSEIQQLKEDVQLVKDFIRNRCFEVITVKQALLLILVGTEVFLWFFVGETIGKMHLVGYKV